MDYIEIFNSTQFKWELLSLPIIKIICNVVNNDKSFNNFLSTCRALNHWKKKLLFSVK